MGQSWIKQEWIDKREPYDRMACSFTDALDSVNAELRYEASEKSVYDKLIRYYVSVKGEKILKIKNPECETNANPVTRIHAGGWVCHVCNHLKPEHPMDNINYSFYIEKANKLINNIAYKGKKHKVEHVDQMKLF